MSFKDTNFYSIKSNPLLPINTCELNRDFHLLSFDSDLKTTGSGFSSESFYQLILTIFLWFKETFSHLFIYLNDLFSKCCIHLGYFINTYFQPALDKATNFYHKIAEPKIKDIYNNTILKTGDDALKKLRENITEDNLYQLGLYSLLLIFSVVVIGYLFRSFYNRKTHIVKTSKSIAPKKKTSFFTWKRIFIGTLFILVASSLLYTFVDFTPFIEYFKVNILPTITPYYNYVYDNILLPIYTSILLPIYINFLEPILSGYIYPFYVNYLEPIINVLISYSKTIVEFISGYLMIIMGKNENLNQ